MVWCLGHLLVVLSWISISTTCIAKKAKAKAKRSANVKCDFARVDASKLDVDVFRSTFRRDGAEPVVLTGLNLGLQEGPCSVEELAGKDVANVKVETEDVVVYRSSGGGNPAATALGSPTTLAALLEAKDDTLYLIKGHHKAMKAVAKNCLVPPPLTPIQLTGPTLSVGGLNATSPFHQHPENWFAQVRGSKAWVVSPNDISAEALQKQGLEPCREHHAKEALAGFKRCTLEAGEVLYLPSQWHHGTCNVAPFSLGVGFIGALDHLPPLHFAAAVGNEEEIKRLVSDGHVVRKPDAEGKHALHWAASRGHVKVLDLLLASRADTEAVDGIGAQALHLAAFDGHVAVARALARSGSRSVSPRTQAGAQPLHLAASRGHVAMAKYLLQGKAAVNARDSNGAEPLHMAAYEGHTKIVAFLLSRGGAPLAKSEDGTTPADLAQARKHHALASRLRHGAATEL